MRRPYKCYVCEMEFNVAKDFNYHLETPLHMDKAFKRGGAKSSDKQRKSDAKDDEWVEKKSGSSRRDRREDSRKDKKDSRSGGSSRKDERQERGDDERRDRDRKERGESRASEGTKEKNGEVVKESPSKSGGGGDSRKVEIVDESGGLSAPVIKDLRQKLQAHKMIITKENSPAIVEEGDDEMNEEDREQKKDGSRSGSVQGGGEGDPAGNSVPAEGSLEQYEIAFEAKFKELMAEYADNANGLQDRLGRDREEDINAYQKYEEDFKELQVYISIYFLWLSFYCSVI